MERRGRRAGPRSPGRRDLRARGLGRCPPRPGPAYRPPPERRRATTHRRHRRAGGTRRRCLGRLARLRHHPRQRGPGLGRRPGPAKPLCRLHGDPWGKPLVAPQGPRHQVQGRPRPRRGRASRRVPRRPSGWGPSRGEASEAGSRSPPWPAAGGNTWPATTTSTSAKATAATPPRHAASAATAASSTATAAPTASASYANAASANHDEQATAPLPRLRPRGTRQDQVLGLRARPRPGPRYSAATRLWR
jgi:hypothetical protein